MKRNKQIKKGLLLNIFFILLFDFTSCKKYPEDKGIPLGYPDRRIIGSYVITEYNVNGVDCLSYISTKLNVDISTIKWEFLNNYHRGDISSNKQSGYGSYSFANKDKELNIFWEPFAVPSWGISKYNVFLSTSSNWTILQLQVKKKKHRLKLRRDYNGKTYTILFN